MEKTNSSPGLYLEVLGKVLEVLEVECVKYEV